MGGVVAIDCTLLCVAAIPFGPVCFHEDHSREPEHSLGEFLVSHVGERQGIQWELDSFPLRNQC